MFKKNAKVIYEAKPDIFKQFNRKGSLDKIEEWEDLQELVSDSSFDFLNHQLLSFIK